MMQEILEQLRQEDNFRTLPQIKVEGRYITCDSKRYLNLSSNDYMGVSSSELYHQFMNEVTNSDEFLLSNPSSRLITGNSPDYEQLEQTISQLYGGRSVLILGSGYLVNSGVLPAVTSKEDLILADKLVHASIIDGLRLSEATWQRFNHNDMEHLERLLKKYRDFHRNIWVVTESLFSMDGDRAQIKEIVELKKKYGFKIYIDEAHAFGTCAERGRGVAAEQGVEEQCDIIVATFGKAIASQGAFVATDSLTRDLLVNRMRTLIFSTAIPPISLRWTDYVISRLDTMEPQRLHLQHISQTLCGNTQGSYIVPIMAGENSRAIEISRQIREEGYWVTPIRYPTVAKGTARVRISLTAAITKDEIIKLAKLCRAIG